jgi:hypothetical protein
MKKNKKKIIGFLVIIVLLVSLIAGFVLIKNNQDIRRGASNGIKVKPVKKLGYPCRGTCKQDYCSTYDLKWSKGDCPEAKPYCCQN